MKGSQTRQPSSVAIPAQIYEAIVAHSRFTHPEEACGLLAADSVGRLKMVYCLTNATRSQTSYTVEPTEHFRALQHAESRGWELVGVFHSHPFSVAFPSAVDLRLATEPDWIYLIVGPFARPEVRGFYLRDGTINEATLRVVD